MDLIGNQKLYKFLIVIWSC